MRSLKRTAGIAAIFGILFGLVLRFHAAQRPGASLFHTGQSFPAREWKGITDPSKDNLDNVLIEAPGSSRPNSSQSTEPNPAPAPEKPSERPPDNPVNTEPPPSIAPSRNRRTAAPSEFPQDPGSDDFSMPERPDRSTIPDFPLQRDPKSITAPAPIRDPIPEPVTGPESPTAPRSTPRPNLSPKKGL